MDTKRLRGSFSVEFEFEFEFKTSDKSVLTGDSGDFLTVTTLKLFIYLCNFLDGGFKKIATSL